MRASFHPSFRPILLLTLFLALPYFFIHASTLHRFLLRSIARTSGVEIAFEKSDLSLLKGQMRIDHLVVTDTHDRFGMETNELRCSLSPVSLLRGKLIISHLDFDHPKVTLKGSSKPLPPDLLKRIFTTYEHSLLLQNLAIKQLRLHSLEIEKPSKPAWRIQEVSLRLEPTLLNQLEATLHLVGLEREKSLLDILDLELTLSGRGIDLTKLNLKKEQVSLSLKGNWEGDIEKGLLKLEGHLAAETVLAEPLSFQLEGSLEEKILKILQLTAQLGHASLTANGLLKATTGDYHLDFQAHDLPLESLFQKLPGPLLSQSKGVAELEGTANGKLPSLQIEARAKIAEFRHLSLYAKNAEGVIRLHWPTLEFDASVRPGTEGEEQVRVVGQVAFGHLPGMEKLQALPQSIQLNFKSASLSEILPHLKLTGRLEGILKLEGVETSVRGTGRGKVVSGTVGDLMVDELESTMTLEPGGDFSFTDTLVTLSGATIRIPGRIDVQTSDATIHFSGTPTPGFTLEGDYFKEPDRFETHFKGNFPLAWLQFFPEHFQEASGVAATDLKISGKWQNPTLLGWFRFREGEITLRRLPPISNLVGTITFEENRTFLDLEGRLEEGPFHLKGTTRPSGLRPEEFDLSLRGSNLFLARSGVWRLELDCNLTLRGHLPSPLLSGEVGIVDGKYTKKFLVRELVLKPFENPEQPADWEQVVGPIHLDLTVKNRGDLWVKNNVASILLTSDLKIKGNYAEPRILGGLTVLEGTIHYLGQDFELTEGRLDFSNPDRTEPYLTLRAEQQIPPSHTVYIQAKGYLSNIEIDLTSSPSLPREEILSLITFGMTEAELRATGQSRSSLTSKILAEEISTVLEKPVVQATGLDIIRFEASESSGGLERPVALSRVSLGKRVTDRFSLEFKTDLAPETAERTLQANYYLTDNILLKGFRTRTATTEPRYQFNLSLRFRLR